MEKKRICVFLERWESGGIESVISNILLHADQSLVCADIVATVIGDSIFTDALRARGVNFIELTGKLRSRRNYKELASLLKRERYDALHLNIFHGAAFEYAHVAKKHGVPSIIAHAHGAGLRPSPLRPFKLLLHRIGRALFSGAVTARLACSEAAGRFLYGERADFTVVPNGVNTDKFACRPERREAARAALGVDGVLLGTVGRLSPEKNQSFAIDVLLEYLKLDPSARLLITGEGETEAALKEKAHELGISDSVIFLGTSKSVEDLMLAMDVMLFPSTAEGFGIVAVEAAVSALPVICSTGVPKCVAITERTVHIPLSDGAAAWARCAKELCEKYPDRRDMSDEVSRAGYSADAAARAVLSYYGGEK